MKPRSDHPWRRYIKTNVEEANLRNKMGEISVKIVALKADLAEWRRELEQVKVQLEKYKRTT